MIYDNDKISQSIERAQSQHSNNDRFLYRWAEIQIKDRLQDIKREFKNTLIISDFPTILEDESVSEDKGLKDCVISIFNLHRTNNLNAHIKKIKSSLKPDGMFLGVIFGDDSIKELRRSLIRAETNLYGGCHQRALPLLTKQQAGDMMQAAGFSLPVIDSEYVHVGYKEIETLYKDLRAMGETNCLKERSRKPISKLLFKEVATQYKEHFSKDGKYEATFEVIFCIGWAPHSSQQQPLKPGTGTTSLKDVL